MGDIPDLRLPTWEAIEAREYEPWDHERLVVDTAGRDLSGCVEQIVAVLDER